MTAIKVGDIVRATRYSSFTYEVIAVNGRMAWLVNGDGDYLTSAIADLTLVPPKIAEPPAGSVVWDDGVPWMRTHISFALAWFSVVGGYSERRSWDDFSDSVTLAVDPKGASHD